MKRVALLALAAAALHSLAPPPAAHAQPAKKPVASSQAQTERMAVDLRQGMSLDEVHALLGKPRRTALRDVSGNSTTPSQGTLQWLYSWDGTDRGTLRIDFAPRPEGRWAVTSWEWATY